MSLTVALLVLPILLGCGDASALATLQSEYQGGCALQGMAWSHLLRPVGAGNSMDRIPTQV